MTNEGRVIITGTGIAATTFLMQVLTEMGLPTGYTPGDDPMEWHDRRAQNLPLIIKRPQFCCDLNEWIAEGLVVRYAIVPMRNLTEVADSRRRRSLKGGPNANGGLVYTTIPEDQERVLAQKFYDLMLTIAQRNIPALILDYKRIAKADQLFDAINPVLSPLFPTFTVESLTRAHAAVSARRDSRGGGR